MDDIIINITNLSKTFQMGYVQQGFKNMLLHLPSYIKSKVHAKTYIALDNINIAIKRGERVGITGHNGCGKTTLLSVIGGVYKEYQGTCEVRGRCSMMLALGAGFCPQLSGRENIILNGVLQGKSIKEMKELMEDIIDFAEIGEYIDAPVYQYSSGMLARLGFGVATAIQPEILLVDEVMAVGDASFAQKCEVRINNLLKGGTTLILVSHNPADIKKYCNRVITIDHGKVIADEKLLA